MARIGTPKEKLAEHRAWCDRWKVRLVDGSEAVRDVMADKVQKRFVSGAFRDHGFTWGPEGDYPPIPRVGENFAAMECTDGSWLVVVMNGGEEGLSETTPGSPCAVFMYYAEPVRGPESGTG